MTTPDEHEHRHGHAHAHHDPRTAPGDHDWGAIVDQVELDGEIMAPTLDAAIERLRREVGTAPVTRIVDVGSGPGVATVALALAFPEARVHAVDGSAPLLERAAARAHRTGVGERVTTAVTDLEGGLDAGGPVDVVWVSMVLHHLVDPGPTLAAVHAALRPGGLFAVVEFGPATRVLPEVLDVGPPGFTARYEAALRAAVADHLPPGVFDLDWSARLAEAGFAPVDTAVLTTHHPAPLDATARRWVHQGLVRSQGMARHRLDADDLAALAVLADPDDRRGVLHRDDVEVRVARTLVLARRP